MKIVIEFFRIREPDKARAVLGRETADAEDLDDAIAIAGRMLEKLEMPQRPDGVTITDSQGATVHSALFSDIHVRAENDNDDHPAS